MNFKLQAGQLVMFPSYLMHEVAPYAGHTERITVAFGGAGDCVEVRVHVSCRILPPKHPELMHRGQRRR